MIVQHIRVKYGHGYTDPIHVTKVFGKTITLFLLCIDRR